MDIIDDWPDSAGYGDPEFGKAWDEGVEAYRTGAKNPYPKLDPQKHSWKECRKYLGWEEGYNLAPQYYKDTESMEV